MSSALRGGQKVQLLPHSGTQHRNGSFPGEWAGGFSAPGTVTPGPWVLPCPAGCGDKAPLAPELTPVPLSRCSSASGHFPGCQWEVQHPPVPTWAGQSHGLAPAPALSLVLQAVPGLTELPAPAFSSQQRAQREVQGQPGYHSHAVLVEGLSQTHRWHRSS